MELASEINMNVMLRLSYDDIMSYCSVNTGARVLCNDPYFWMRKLDYDFSTSVDNHKLIPSEYVRLYGTNMGRETYLKCRKMLESSSETFHNGLGYGIWKLSDNRDVVMFRVEKEKNDKIHGRNHFLENLFTRAIRDDDVDLLERLKITGLYTEYSDALRSAIYAGSIKSLDWLERQGIVPNQRDIKEAITFQKIEVIRWLYNRGIRSNINTNDANDMVRKDPNIYGLIYWLRKLDFLPNVEDDKLVELAELRRLLPNRMSAPEVYNILNMSAWLTSHDGTALLDLLLQRNIIHIDQNLLKSAIIKSNIDILRWAANKGVYPDQTTIRQTTDSSYGEVPGWIKENKSKFMMRTDNVSAQSSIPILMQQSPAMIQQSPTMIQQSPAMIQQSPAMMRQSPVTITQSPTMIQQSPAMMQQSPAMMQQSPAMMQQSPAMMQQSPVMITQSPAMITRSPTITPVSPRNPISTMGSILPRSPNSFGRQPQYETFKLDDYNKVLNPESGRWINRGGNVHRSLIARGILRVGSN